MMFAVISDTQLGRYKTLIIGLTCYFAGCIVLVATSTKRALSAGVGLGGLIGSMILVALGAGCVKACFVPFLGDQLKGGKERVERRSGKSVVVSSDRTLQFVYNAYYW
jgi:POT family proton-dependent oligopeptide transporter